MSRAERFLTAWNVNEMIFPFKPIWYYPAEVWPSCQHPPWSKSSSQTLRKRQEAAVILLIRTHSWRFSLSYLSLNRKIKIKKPSRNNTSINQPPFQITLPFPSILWSHRTCSSRTHHLKYWEVRIKASGAFLITKGKTLEPFGLNRRDEIWSLYFLFFLTYPFSYAFKFFSIFVDQSCHIYFL